MSIINPNAWSPEVVEAAGIGPAHPHHPYHLVHYGLDGQPLPAEAAAANVAEARAMFPCFPRLVLRSMSEGEAA